MAIMQWTIILDPYYTIPILFPPYTIIPILDLLYSHFNYIQLQGGAP